MARAVPELGSLGEVAGVFFPLGCKVNSTWLVLGGGLIGLLFRLLAG